MNLIKQSFYLAIFATLAMTSACAAENKTKADAGGSAEAGHNSPSNVPQADWMKDYEAALKTASKEGKTVMVYFSGSDWCGPCISLENEVLHEKEFVEYAKKNLILVKADFTPYGTPIADDFVGQHLHLYEMFRVRGFPTAVLLSSEGKFIEKFYAYRKGGPKKYVEFLKGLISGGA